MAYQNRASQDQTIESFVSFMEANGFSNLKITSWPDKKPGSKREIDAIAENSTAKFAIEHSSVDTYANQRRDTDYFMKAIGNVESKVKNKLSFRLSLAIKYDSVKKGMNWEEIQDSFEKWILNDSKTLPDGESVQIVQKVPFKIHIRKQSNRIPGLFISRFTQEDNSLVQRLRDQIKDKSDKLVHYKKKGFHTVLLIESNDLALMNKSLMEKSISLACEESAPEGSDQIWVADISIPDDPEFWNLTLHS